MDRFELAEQLYEDNRYETGDGDHTWEDSLAEADEIIQSENETQEAQEDFDRDLYDSIERDDVSDHLD